MAVPLLALQPRVVNEFCTHPKLQLALNGPSGYPVFWVFQSLAVGIFCVIPLTHTRACLWGGRGDTDPGRVALRP